jgi:hypothetical protein
MTIAAVIALSETALAAATYTVGRRQRRMAGPAQSALAELQARIAGKLTLGAFRMVGPPGTVPYRLSPRIVFGLVALLSVGAAIYAAIH